MTNNIVAYFSCSLNIDGTFKEYRVVAGSVFNEEYSETLDSATIRLSQIPKEDRLVNIKPYDFVRVFDKSGNTGFDKIYLVDNFNEKEININEHIFAYTINLMSETKLLEKIQCPNVAITHKVNSDGTTTKKTIYQLIKQYMDLYVPKIKYSSDGTSWSYQPLITYPTDPNSAFYKKFDYTAADMGFGSPTLRQLLTTIMQQVGCIPTVHNRVLGFLDFQDDAEPFGNGDYTVNNTVNLISRSLSSDSFVNNLVNISSNVLDSGNEVISETLCFRDKNTVLLKQKENLYLETSFPIYKVNKCLFHAPGKYTGYISSSYGCFYVGTAGAYPALYYNQNTISDGTATVTFSCNFVNSSYYNVSIFNHKIYFLGRDTTTGNYYIISDAAFNDFVLDSSTTSQHTETYDSMQVTTQNRSFTFSDLSSNIVGFFISGQFSGDNGVHSFAFVKFDDADDNIYYWNVRASDNIPYGHGPDYVEHAAVAGYKMLFSGLRTWDITRLVVENGVRQLLERDFTKMNQQLAANKLNDYTVDKVEYLSKYVYGTVGYSIGSKQISGFSDVYNVGSTTMLGWITKEYTYIENILNILQYDFFCEEEILLNKFEFFKYMPITFGISNATVNYPSILSRGTLIDYVFNYYNPTNNSFSGSPFFSSCFVDLYYQPLNSFNLAYSKSKEDIDVPLQQYDGNASGLTDFDRLSIHEQEQVDRVGNETLSINQRTNNFADIQKFDNGPLIFMDDTNRDGSINTGDKGIEYIIFKYSYTIKNNCFDVSYIGAKDAVLKNYFTSIRTKYRAYQYVDYSQSTLRKERDTFYIRISSDWYRGDDKIWLGNYQNGSGNQFTDVGCFMYDLSNGTKNPVSYECENDTGLIYNGLAGTTSENQTTKNSVSLITTNNMMGIVYEHVDNVGAGPYIADITNDQNLGGIPQSWQIWGSDYSTKHLVSYVSYIDFYSMGTNETADVNEVKDYISRWQKAPIVDDDFIDLTSSDYNIFSVCDDNSVEPNGDIPDGLKRTFYKDDAECINHTVQFIYYAPNNDVLFGEDFISGTPVVGRFNNRFYRVYGSNDFELNVESHNIPSGDTLLANRETTATFSLNKSNIDQGPTGQGFQKYYVHLEYNIPTELVATKDKFTIRTNDVQVSGATLVSGEPFEVAYDDYAKLITISMYITSGDVTNLHISVPYTYLEDESFCNDYIRFSTEAYPGSVPLDRYNVVWHGYKAIKLCSYDYDTQKIKDIVVFKNPNDGTLATTFFFTINDTKTDYVLSSQNNILYRRYLVRTSKSAILTNTVLDRKCKRLYLEGDWSTWEKNLIIQTTNASITVSRTSSLNPDAPIGSLSNGDYVYPGDVLTFSNIETPIYYHSYQLKINNEVFDASQEYTVSVSDDEDDIIVNVTATDLITTLSSPVISTKYYQYIGDANIYNGLETIETNDVWCEISCSEENILPTDVMVLYYTIGSESPTSTVIENNGKVTIELGNFPSSGSVSIHDVYLEFVIPNSGNQSATSSRVSKTYSIATPLAPMNDPVIIETKMILNDRVLSVAVENTNDYAVKCYMNSSMDGQPNPNYYFNVDAESSATCLFTLPIGTTSTFPTGTLMTRFESEETNRVSVGSDSLAIMTKMLSVTTSDASGTVSRTLSPAGATTGVLSDGDVLYFGDVLEFNFTPDTYYQSIYTVINNTIVIDETQPYTVTSKDGGVWVIIGGNSEFVLKVAASGDNLVNSLSNPPVFSTKYTHDYSTNEVTVTVSCDEPELQQNDTMSMIYMLNGNSATAGPITNHTTATINLGTYNSATTLNITLAQFKFEFPSSYGFGRFALSDDVDKTYNISARNLVNPSITINGYESPRVNVSFTNNNSFSVVCHYSSSSGLDGGSQTIPAHSSITKQMRHRPGEISMTISAYFVVESSSSIQISETVSTTWSV